LFGVSFYRSVLNLDLRQHVHDAGILGIAHSDADRGSLRIALGFVDHFQDAGWELTLPSTSDKPSPLR